MARTITIFLRRFSSKIIRRSPVRRRRVPSVPSRILTSPLKGSVLISKRALLIFARSLGENRRSARVARLAISKPQLMPQLVVAHVIACPHIFTTCFDSVEITSFGLFF